MVPKLASGAMAESNGTHKCREDTQSNAMHACSSSPSLSRQKSEKGNSLELPSVDVSCRPRPSSASALIKPPDTEEARRRWCTSDTTLSRSLSTKNTLRHNTNFANHQSSSLFVAQRSGKHGVKDIIASIQRSTVRSESDGTLPPPPEAECGALVQCGRDPYYRAVIFASGGVGSILAAMTAHLAHAGLQASACAALGNLCVGNAAKQRQVFELGGFEAVANAMRAHPSSIVVQSVACDVLQFMTSMLLPSDLEKVGQMPDLGNLLKQASAVCMTTQSKESAEIVLQRIRGLAAT